MFETNDLRLAQQPPKMAGRISRSRKVRVSLLAVRPSTDRAIVCIAALFELQRRLNWRQSVQLCQGKTNVTRRWWSSHFIDFEVRTVTEMVVNLLRMAGASPLSDAITVEIEPNSQAEHSEPGGLAIACEFGDDEVCILVHAPMDWGKTVDPVAEIDAVAEMFSALLAAFLCKPNELPGAAPAMNIEERSFVLGSLAGRARDFGDFRPVPRLLEDSVAKYQDRVAYRFRYETLTFHKFERLANGLAVALLAEGISKGDVVPLLFSNGFEMPLVYYSLMKCGAALVPLDQDWPEDRLIETLRQFTSRMILCAEGVSLPAGYENKRRTVRFKDIEPSSDVVAVPLAPEDLIYGFFTSGTTGKPKCALNNHGALANRFAAMNRYLGNIGGPVLQNTRYMYDSSIGHLLLPLTQGFEVIIPEDRAILDLHYSIDMVAKHQIAMTDFVPSVLNQMISLVGSSPEAQSKLSSLRELIVGGEQITPKMIHKLRALLSPELRISNCYGITETAIGLTYHPVRDEDGTNIPLGRPLDNCYLIVVDDKMRPLPRGAIGQLLIGGVCLGSGYMHNSQRTAEVFIANPFPEIPGKMLYCTGDQAYFDGQGNLQFQGRRDFQTKIAGVMIEPREIEVAAFEMPEVHHAKAFVYTKKEKKTLALIAAGEPQLESDSLARHLRAKLPRALVPRHVLVLPAMPLADSGKLDQDQLQSILEAHLAQQQSADLAVQEDSQRNILQEVLAVFRWALSDQTLGLGDDFFHRGGDSLQAVNATLELDARFKVPFGVADLAQNSTAEAAGRRIETLLAKGERQTASADRIEQDVAQLGKTLPARFETVASSPPKAVFLTGATGFVGSYLAREIANHPGTRVFALCRPGAPNRLQKLMESKGLWRPEFNGRLEIIPGDLSALQLGLDDTTWERLARECDAILHCGGMVNFLYDYQAHRAANVLGTHGLLNLARTGRTKSFHYISTLGVLNGGTNVSHGPAPDTLDPGEVALPHGGYSQSKLAAERIILQAGKKGLSTTVYRLGEIMPAAEGGAPNEDALTHVLLSAFLAIEAAPVMPILSDWTPVDHVAQQITNVLFSPESWGRTYHLFSPQSVSFNTVLQNTGVELEMLTANEWLSRLDDYIAQHSIRDLLLLRFMLPETSQKSDLDRAFAGLLVDNPRYFTCSTGSVLAKTAQEPTEAQRESVRNYATYLLDRRSAAPGPNVS